MDPDNPSLWLDGEWANPSRPIPSPPKGQILTVEDNASGFSKGQGGPFNNPCPPGTCQYWFEETSGGSNNHYFWTSTNSIASRYWARWEPTLANNAQGWYEVQAYIPNTNFASSWQVPYTILHADGFTVATVDQYDARNASDRWISLGTYRFTPGNAFVYLTNVTYEAYRVHCYNATGITLNYDYCTVAADAVRFIRLPTFLPNIDSNSSGDSGIYIRNDGAMATRVSVTFLDSSGNVLSSEVIPYPPQILAPHGRVYYNPTQSGAGSLIVDSPQPVSVAVTQQILNPFRAAAYSGVNQPGTETFVPLLHKNNGAWTSDIFIQNTRNVAANVTVEFKVAAVFGQGQNCTQNYTIAAYGMQKIDLGSLSCVGSSFLGGARITSSQPVAVATTERTGSLLMETSNAVGPATGTGYLPLIQNEGGTGWTSGLSLQNVSNNTQTLSASYYIRNGAACGSASYPNVGAYRSYIVNPFPPSCPDIIEGATLTGPDRVTAMLNQLRPTNSYASTYTAIAAPSKTIYLPFWSKQSGWVPGLAVYNPNNQAVNVNVRYYDANGSFNIFPTSQSLIAAHGVAIFYNTPSASTFNGSALIIADQPVTAVVNHSSSSSGGDGLMTYEGLH